MIEINNFLGSICYIVFIICGIFSIYEMLKNDKKKNYSEYLDNISKIIKENTPVCAGWIEIDIADFLNFGSIINKEFSKLNKDELLEVEKILCHIVDLCESNIYTSSNIGLKNLLNDLRSNYHIGNNIHITVKHAICEKYRNIIRIEVLKKNKDLKSN